MLTIRQVNAMTREEFIDSFGDVAEHSSWVAEQAFAAQPWSDADGLYASFADVIMRAPAADMLALVRAHPDLAGRAALAGTLGQDSASEQAGAGLDSLTEQEFEKFSSFNARYLARFEFPFIFAVKGADKHQILAGFENRIDNDRDEEFATARQQVLKIVQFRLQDRVL